MFVAIRDALLSHAGFNSVFAGLNSLDLQAVECAIDRDMNLTAFEGNGDFGLGSLQQVKQFEAELAGEGVNVCALLMANDFSSDDFQGEVDWLVRTCDAARELGVPAVRIDLLPKVEMPREEFLQRCIDGVSEALDRTEGIELGIENHGAVTNDAAFVDSVLEGVYSSRLGLTLDTGNFYWYGLPLEQVYANMEHFADRVKHTHLKNIGYPADKRDVEREMGWKYREYVCPIPDGDVDHERVLSILREAGYDRGLAIEDESCIRMEESEYASALERNVDYLKSLL